MRVGEPVYAIKFMAKIGEGSLEEAIAVLRDSVAPVLRESGFGEVLALARPRRLEKLDPQGPGIAGSRLLRRLVEEAPPHEADHQYVLRKLPSHLGGDVPTGFAHSMALHHLKEKKPAEYQRRRDARIARQRRLEEKVLAEENRIRMAGYQLDCYALYGSEEDMKADTLDLENRKMRLPHSASFLARELGPLLFVELFGVHYTVLHSMLPQAPQARRGGLLAAQIQVPVIRCREGEAVARVRSSLVPDLSARDGFAGALALRGRCEGFSREGFDWTPRSLAEHRGDSLGPYYAGGGPLGNDPTVPYEVVTLWQTGADLQAGVEWLTGSVPEVLGDALSSHVTRTDSFSRYAEKEAHTERGELLLRSGAAERE